MVPALLHDGALVSESAAITLYLTDLYPQVSLGPAVGQPGRGDYLMWLAYNAGEMEPAFAAKLSGQTEQDPFSAKAFDRVLRRVFSALEAGPHIMGERFSAADILVASPFQWYRTLVPPSTLLDEWLQRLAARPAAIRAAHLDERPK
jgi:glutathione S-transferase